MMNAMASMVGPMFGIGTGMTSVFTPADPLLAGASGTTVTLAFAPAWGAAAASRSAAASGDGGADDAAEGGAGVASATWGGSAGSTGLASAAGGVSFAASPFFASSRACSTRFSNLRITSPAAEAADGGGVAFATVSFGGSGGGVRLTW